MRLRFFTISSGYCGSTVTPVVVFLPLALLTVPFVWDEHEQPRDFGRYSSFGLSALLGRNGLRVLRQEKTAGDVKALFQLVNAYLYKVTVTRSAYLNLLVALVLMAPVNMLGSVLAWVLPRNADLFLDNVVLAPHVGGEVGRAPLRSAAEQRLRVRQHDRIVVGVDDARVGSDRLRDLILQFQNTAKFTVIAC